jgi:hypothetical protein
MDGKMNKYTVSIWPANPSLQHSEDYHTKAAAVDAARRRLGEVVEEGQSASKITIEHNGEQIAVGVATGKRLRWL